MSDFDIQSASKAFVKSRAETLRIFTTFAKSLISLILLTFMCGMGLAAKNRIKCPAFAALDPQVDRVPVILDFPSRS